MLSFPIPSENFVPRCKKNAEIFLTADYTDFADGERSPRRPDRGARRRNMGWIFILRLSLNASEKISRMALFGPFWGLK